MAALLRSRPSVQLGAVSRELLPGPPRVVLVSPLPAGDVIVHHVVLCAYCTPLVAAHTRADLSSAIIGAPAGRPILLGLPQPGPQRRPGRVAPGPRLCP